MKFGIVGRVKAGEKVKVLEEKAGWIKIRLRRGRKGWISQRTFQRGWRHSKVKKNVKSPPIKVVLKFQNIPRPCIKVFAESLRELEKHLMPIGDKELELVISVEPRLRSYYMFLTIDFNLSFYRRAMKRFSQPETIDLLPFNSCIWAMRAYKQFLLRSLENKGESQGCSFIKKMAICLVLRR